MADEPALAYPPGLPVAQRADEIAAAIRAHQVVIVCGETGSGKTTQLPKICIAAVRASHVPERSGDITILPQPGWIFVLGTSANGGDGTTHGSPHVYDQHVPLVFLGGAFQPGHYATHVTPADVAPTLASTIGMPMHEVEGRPLTDAVAHRPPPQ